MKKIAFLLFLSVFASLVFFSISCQHTLPHPSSGCDGSFNVTVQSTPDTTNNGHPDGTITLTATGGTSFTFSLNGGQAQTGSIFTGLTGGQTYSIIGTSNLGCADTVSVTIGTYNNNPNPCPTIIVTVNSTNPTSATATNGSITANASGGTAPYTFSISGGAFTSSATFSNLGIGSYVIIAKDANGCTGQVSTSLTNSPCPTINVTANGTNPTSSTANNGSVAAIASGGAAPYTYSKDGANYVSASTFTGLSAGTYTIYAKDANGCIGQSASVTLINPAPCPTITVTATAGNRSTTICSSDGTATVSASGGVAPYTYSKDGINFQSSTSLTGLSVQTYTITAKDANGCTGTATVTILGPTTVSFTNDIKPTINATCGRANIGCHSHINSWTSYSDIVGISSGTTWTSNLSTFLKRIRSTTGSANSACPLTTSSGNHDMPPTSSTAWTNFVKGALTNWVDQGYPNN